MGVAEDFLRANREVWSLIEKHMEDPSRIMKAVKIYGYKYDLLINSFAVSNALAKDMSYFMNTPVEHVKKLSTIGLHIAMFQSRKFINALISEAGVPKSNEIELGKAIGLQPDAMRECLEHCFDSVLNATLPTMKECRAYWQRGAFLPHIGALAFAVSDKPPPGDPRIDVVNALVPWVLGIARDIVTGSHGAGVHSSVRCKHRAGEDEHIILHAESRALHPRAPGAGSHSPKPDNAGHGGFPGSHVSSRGVR